MRRCARPRPPIRVLEAEKQSARAAAAVLLVAETAWQARRIDDARNWTERGIEMARASGDAEHLAGLLSLAATLANLRGEYAKAAAYQAEIEKLAPEEKAAEEELPRGGTLVVAVANPIAATEPGLYETNEEQEVARQRLRTPRDDRRPGQPRAGALREVDLRGRTGSRSGSTCGRGSSSPTALR